MNTDQMKTIYQKKIKEYVEKHQNQNLPIKSKVSMFREINSDIPLNKQCSASHFYKYLDSLDFYMYSSLQYGFKNNRVILSHALQSKGLKEQIVFFISKPELGQLMANIINTHYYKHDDIYMRYFHCISLSDVIICYYENNPKLEPFPLTHQALNKSIPQILKEHFIDTGNYAETGFPFFFHE